MIRLRDYKCVTTDSYLNAVKGIVPTNALWLAVRTREPVQKVVVDGCKGYAIKDGPVITLQGMDWNGMLATAMVDPNDGFDGDLQFEVPSVAEVRIGTFEEMYRKGCVVWPLDDYSDYDNNPIVLIKG